MESMNPPIDAEIKSVDSSTHSLDIDYIDAARSGKL